MGIANVQIMTQAWMDMCKTAVSLTDTPGLPAIEVPHPMAGSGEDRMREVAERIVPQIARVWAGDTDEVRWDGA